MQGKELVIDEEKIKSAARTQVPLKIRTFTLPHETEVYIEKILDIFLEELGQKTLKSYLNYCVRELAANAKKANTKRVYFESLGFDIHNKAQYDQAMIDFKSTTLGNISHYLRLQKEKGYYIQISFQAKDSQLIVEVRNNAELVAKEYMRIQDKLAHSRKYTNLDEALSKIFDPSEGAGLGLVIMSMMLRKINIDEECFDIWTEKKETIARIRIPIAQTKLESVSMLTDAIVRSISSLPQFPENISNIQKLIATPDCKLTDIAQYISTDPAMTADILKIVNSAIYMLAKKVDSISDAVRLVGLRGISNLLYSYGAIRVLGKENTTEKKMLWNHSYRTAFYSYNLARNLKTSHKNLIDDSYVAGMLHDMGKIVFSAMHPDLLAKIRNFCIFKNISSELLENMEAGMHHAEIGALIAQRWRFPDALVAAIRYHHQPDDADPQYRDLVRLVYLANMSCKYGDREIAYADINKNVLKDFNLSDELTYRSIISKMSDAFYTEQGKILQKLSGR